MEFARVQNETKNVPMMPFTLEGKTALVTGAGRGIGKAIAKRLVSAGARVMINDLDEGMLLESAAELSQPDRVSHVAGDLTDPAIPEMIVHATLAEFSSIDIIVNNAGYSWDNVIQKTTDEQFQAMLEIHLVTPFRILRAASELNIRTVAIYTWEDRYSLHRYKADEAWQVGKNDDPLKPYLDIESIIHTAKHAKADAIHIVQGDPFKQVFIQVVLARKVKHDMHGIRPGH